MLSSQTFTLHGYIVQDWNGNIKYFNCSYTKLYASQERDIQCTCNNFTDYITCCILYRRILLISQVFSPLHLHITSKWLERMPIVISQATFPVATRYKRDIQVYIFPDRSLEYCINGHHTHHIPVKAEVVKLTLKLSTNTLSLSEPYLSAPTAGEFHMLMNTCIYTPTLQYACLYCL